MSIPHNQSFYNQEGHISHLCIIKNETCPPLRGDFGLGRRSVRPYHNHHINPSYQIFTLQYFHFQSRGSLWHSLVLPSFTLAIMTFTSTLIFYNFHFSHRIKPGWPDFSSCHLTSPPVSDVFCLPPSYRRDVPPHSKPFSFIKETTGCSISYDFCSIFSRGAFECVLPAPRDRNQRGRRSQVGEN